MGCGIANAMASAIAEATYTGYAPIPIPISTCARLLLLPTDTGSATDEKDDAIKEADTMTLNSGWCLSNQHDDCPVSSCPCDCHGQVDGQESLLPDPRTTTEVPF